MTRTEGRPPRQADPAVDALGGHHDPSLRPLRSACSARSLLALLAGCAGQEDPPTPPPADTSEPPSAISPPLLAYEVDGEIFLADADGDNPVRVTDEVAANGGDS